MPYRGGPCDWEGEAEPKVPGGCPAQGGRQLHPLGGEIREGRTTKFRHHYCPKGLLCRDIKKIDVCASVRPSDRPSVRASVTLIGSAPDLVTRNWVLPLQRRSSTPKTGRLRDDLRASGSSVHHLLSSDHNHVICCVIA